MVQWVKNKTATPRVTAKVQVRFQARCSGLKDLVLSQRLGFNPWPGNLHMLWMCQKKKKIKNKKRTKYFEVRDIVLFPARTILCSRSL